MTSAAIDLLTEREAAERLRVCERTLRGLRKRGLIRYVAITKRKIMYRPEDCAEYVESRLRQESPANDRAAPRPIRRRSGNIIPFSKLCP